MKRFCMFVALLSLATLCSVSSAAPRNCTDIRIDDNFGPYNIAKILSAVDYWNLVGHLNLCARIVHIPSHEKATFMVDNVVTFYDASQGWPGEEWDRSSIVGKHTLAYTTVATGDVFVGRTSLLWKVAIHELGHSFGCKHTQNKWDIMYPIVTWSPSAITKGCRETARKRVLNYATR